ncbi:MAG TPA: mandelate racemase/muconate lactonizing enzyme family protein [Planctomycetota bacterium]|jgi:galactonate dehydratase|nr:mandelate racemase/muconate lactonizing enzyme family protein [Planctomycetota bacterium]
MKITRLTPLVLGTPWRNLTFLKVETDEGLVGVSEGRNVNRTEALLGYLQGAARRHVLGSDPFRIEDLVRRMFVEDYARVEDISGMGIALVEIACWDIVGKALGRPVYQLLGGAVRDRIKAYANGWYTVDRTPEAFHEAARKVAARGYRALKVDPFGAGFYELEAAELRRSVALVEAIRDAVGPDVEILIEMHGRFSPATAVTVARELEPFKPSWVEEPVPPDNFEALAKAAAKIRIPVATGERIHTRHEVRRLLELGAVDVLQTDITESCGLLEGKKIAAMADASYVTFAPHNVGGPVSTAACLHLDACTTNFKIQEHFNDFVDAWVKQAASGPGYPEVKDGYFPLPGGPGLGVTLNEDFIREHPMKPEGFNLFRENWHRRQTAGG